MRSFKEFGEEKGPCWDGYVQVGTKMKNGKRVPNCVPKEEVEEALVAADRAIVKDILRRVEDSMVDALKRGDEEFVNNIARHVKMKVTKKKQARGKAFSYKLK